MLQNSELNITQPGGSGNTVAVTTAGGTSQSVEIPVDDPPDVGPLHAVAVFPPTAGADAGRLLVTDNTGMMQVLEPGTLASVRSITRPGPSTAIVGLDFITADVVVEDAARGNVNVPAGSLAFANAGNTPDRLYYLDPAGSGTVLADVPLGGATPGDVAGGGGLAWHASRGTWFVTSTGAAVQSFHTGFFSSTSQNRGDLAVDPTTGNLWFGGSDRRLVQIDPDSGVVIGNYDPVGNNQFGTVRLEHQGVGFRTNEDVSGLDFDDSGIRHRGRRG